MRFGCFASNPMLTWILVLISSFSASFIVGESNHQNLSPLQLISNPNPISFPRSNPSQLPTQPSIFRDKIIPNLLSKLQSSSHEFQDALDPIKKLISSHFLTVPQNNDTKLTTQQALDSNSNTDHEISPKNTEGKWTIQGYNLNRIYFDAHCSGYINLDLHNDPQTNEFIDPRVQWLFEHLSKVWEYVKNSYGYFGQDPRIYIVLQTENKDINIQNINPAIYFKNKDFRNVIFFNFSKITNNTLNSLVSLTKKVGYIVEFGSKGTFGSPAANVWGEIVEKSEVPRSKWVEIFIYDIFLKIGLQTEAERYLNSVMDQKENFPREGTFWLKEWFWPIYQKYGEIFVLRSFFGQLHLNFLRERKTENETESGVIIYTEYKGKMNMGEFVHFWSGAAGTNLRDQATKAFGWTQNYQREFEKARITYPSIEYKCEDCQSIPNDEYSKRQAEEEDEIQELILIIIISVSILVVIVVGLCACLVFKSKKIHRLTKEIRELTSDEIKEFFEGCALTQFKESRRGSEQSKNNACIQAKPFDRNYELSKERLVIAHDQVIGSGQYGMVLNGFIKGPKGISEDELMPVAVKTVKPDVDVEYFKALLSELKVMAHLGVHDNIASLMGACTVNIKNREIYIALELCAHGDLREHLIQNRNNFRDLFKAPKSKKVNEHAFATEIQFEPIAEGTNELNATHSRKFTTLNLLQWSRDIAHGMDYIARKKVIHGDLAARNILLTGDNVAKVSDFGLSRQLVNYSTYLKTSKTPLPWRWMAIESLKDMHFSTNSDVWAYGVTLWEIFSLGETPYPGWTWDYDFVNKLAEGRRLLSPVYANQSIYKIMFDCWELNALKRPSFSNIRDQLQNMVSETNAKLHNGRKSEHYVSVS